MSDEKHTVWLVQFFRTLFAQNSFLLSEAALLAALFKAPRIESSSFTVNAELPRATAAAAAGPNFWYN